MCFASAPFATPGALSSHAVALELQAGRPQRHRPGEQPCSRRSPAFPRGDYASFWQQLRLMTLPQLPAGQEYGWPRPHRLPWRALSVRSWLADALAGGGQGRLPASETVLCVCEPVHASDGPGRLGRSHFRTVQGEEKSGRALPGGRLERNSATWRRRQGRKKRNLYSAVFVLRLPWVLLTPSSDTLL